MIPEADKQQLFVAIKNASIFKGAALEPNDVSELFKSIGLNVKEKYGVSSLSELLKEIPGVRVNPPTVAGEQPVIVVEILAKLGPIFAHHLGKVPAATVVPVTPAQEKQLPVTEDAPVATAPVQDASVTEAVVEPIAEQPVQAEEQAPAPRRPRF